MNDCAVTPLFLFGLPRSGSTLLQRLLACHPRISTTAEPWVLLPVACSDRVEGLSLYGHKASARAIQDVAGVGQQILGRAVSAFAQEFYRSHSDPGASYFLDKTPRYWLIFDRIVEWFPDARFLILVRNPLQVLASTIRTFGGGRLSRLAYSWDDLTRGMTALAGVHQALEGRALVIRFEDLVADSGSQLDRVWSYLDLSPLEGVESQFNEVKLAGRKGDPSGRKEYSRISSEPLERWRDDLRGGVRRRVADRMLRSIGPEALQVLGYDLEVLRQDVGRASRLNGLRGIGDVLDILATISIRRYNLHWWGSRQYQWRSKCFVQ